MSYQRLGRARGIAIRCDGDGCDASIVTGNVVLGVNRLHAAVHGWGRGAVRGSRTRRSTLRMDFCPICLIGDELEAQEQRARREARRARRVAGLARRQAKIAQAAVASPPQDAP